VPHCTTEICHVTTWARQGRTGPSKRPPQPVSEVPLQCAPERLLERLLEAPVSGVGFYARLLQARGCFLCLQERGAHLETVGSMKASVRPPGLRQRYLARWTAHACRTCRDSRRDALEARRYPCAHSACGAGLHAPLRGAGPGVHWQAQLHGQHWTCARPCCAVAYGADKVCTGCKQAACGLKSAGVNALSSPGQAASCPLVHNGTAAAARGRGSLQVLNKLKSACSLVLQMRT